MTSIARPLRGARPRPAAPLSLSLLAAALWLLAAAPARAVTIDFDDLPDLSDAAAASLPGVSLSSAQVLSEASVAVLLGYDAAGRWATSGSQGILNSLGPVIRFSFAAPVASFAIDVLGLDKDGVTLPIGLFGYDGEVLVASAISDPGRIGASGLHQDSLSLEGRFTSFRLGALVPCDAELCFAEEGSTLFADTATFRFAPEPGAAALLALGLAVAAGRSRR